jgi:5,10-methylene-tetrahydrofolate dehydrogenase/methenyl tetrahydrofolate cyclohydrolase
MVLAHERVATPSAEELATQYPDMVWGPEGFVELCPDSLPTTDRLVLMEADSQWREIADMTGNHHPTLAQFRGMVALASNRPGPYRDVLGGEEPTSWDTALEHFNRQAPDQAEWDGFVTEHPELWRPSSETRERRAAPRLDIVITDTAPDKISYALRAMAHGAAIGARVRLHGSEEVRNHPKIVRQLETLGEDTTVAFADETEVAHLSEHLPTLHSLQAQQKSLEELEPGFWTTNAEAHAANREALASYYLDAIELRSYRLLGQKIDDLELVVSRLRSQIERAQGAEQKQLAARLDHLITRPDTGIDALRQQRRVFTGRAEARHLFELAGIKSGVEKLLFDRDERLAELVRTLNDDSDVDSILTLLPTSKKGEPLVRAAVTNPRKDADGMNAENGVTPLTPLACITGAEYFRRERLTGNKALRCLVLGFGKLVGEELVAELSARGFQINTPKDAKGVPQYPEAPEGNLGVVDVLPNAQHVRNHAAYVGETEYDIVFCCARGENLVDARTFKAKDGEVVLFIDAAGNVNLKTINDSHAVAPPVGGIGPITTLKLLGSTIQSNRDGRPQERRPEHGPRSRLLRTLRALGSLGGLRTRPPRGMHAQRPLDHRPSGRPSGHTHGHQTHHRTHRERV